MVNGRDVFVETASEQLGYAIRIVSVEDLDVDDFDPRC